MNITFIGLGIMGTGMASNLAKNKIKLTVYNRTKIDNSSYDSENVTVADSLENAVKDADIVFSMLSTPKAVIEVFFGEKGTLSLMKKHAIWADCSTVNPSFSLEAFKEAKARGIRFLDAPVSGSKIPAQNAELIFFVGGDKATVKEAEPFMNMMGKEVIQVGDTGKGASLKMLVNIMLAQSMLIFAEAVLLGEKMGIDKDFLLDFLPNLPVSAPFTKVKAAAIKNDNYDVQFPLEWMHKDLHLAALTAYEVNQPLYIANLTKEIFAAANKEGMGRMDFSAIFKYLEERK